MNILVRVDSSNLIGSGHLMRCLTLAQRYRNEGHRVSFVCRELEGNMAGLVKAQGFQVYMLSAAQQGTALTGYEKWLTLPQTQDAAETVEIIKKIEKVHRVVVDSYAIDETWERIVRPYTDEIFVIDDLANRQHDCDVLLDQNFYLHKEDRYTGLVPEHCRLLLGPRHALLREEFYSARQDMKPRSGDLHNILVFYGGADATDETSKAIEALHSLQENGELAKVDVTVVVGASNARKDAIAARCQRAGFQYFCQVSNMAELMAKADLMLGAGGSTTWERCFLGLPAIVTAVADNQLEICEDCAVAGIIYYLGHWDEVTVDDICQAIRKFTAPEVSISMQKKMSQLFD